MKRPSASRSDAQEMAEFERSVSGPRRIVGLVLAGLGAIGAGVSAFLRIETFLGNEQWASMGSAVFWTAVVVNALLLGHARGRKGPAAIDSMGEASRVPVGATVTALLLVAMAAAAVDCGVAHTGAHPVHKVYPSLVQQRFDADGASPGRQVCWRRRPTAVTQPRDSRRLDARAAEEIAISDVDRQGAVCERGGAWPGDHCDRGPGSVEALGLWPERTGRNGYRAEAIDEWAPIGRMHRLVIAAHVPADLGG
jgi:hypothetical protein